MIRWAPIVCLATFWLLSSMGQQNGSNNRNTINNIRHDVVPSVANSTLPRVIGNDTALRKVSKAPAKRRIWKELLQEFITFKKNILPILMGQSNTSYLKLGNKQVHRQFINMIGDFRFIRTEILYLKEQSIVLVENVTDARRDHKRMNVVICWVMNNVTKIYKEVEKISVYMQDCQRVCAPPYGTAQLVGGQHQEASVMMEALHQINVNVGQVNVSVNQGHEKISGEIHEIQEILRLLGQDVHGNREHIIAGVERLEQSIHIGHSLANNSALHPDLFDAVNQMSQALNEIGKIVMTIDNNLSSGLVQLEQSIHMGHSFLASNISAVSSDVAGHVAAISTLPQHLFDAVNQMSEAVNEIGKIVMQIDGNLSSGLFRLEQSIQTDHSFLANNISVITSQLVNHPDGISALPPDLSDAVNQMSYALNEIGKLVIKIDNDLSAGLVNLEQSIHTDHSFLANNISVITSQLVNHPNGISTLPANLLETVNQLSHGLNEMGKVVMNIDNSLGSGLVDLQLRMNDLLNMANTAVSGVSFLQSEVSVMKVDLNIIKEAVLKESDANGNGSHVPAGKVPPTPGAPPLPYPTLPIYPVYPTSPPAFPHPGSGVPGMHVPGILPTVPRPMWPTPPQKPSNPLHPAQFPTGPHGPGIPIGFANRFTGYCACTCPCPCNCPVMDLGTNPFSSFTNNSGWPFSSHGGYNYGVTGDCFCLCTCTCPRFLGISDQYYPVAGGPPMLAPSYRPPLLAPSHGPPSHGPPSHGSPSHGPPSWGPAPPGPPSWGPPPFEPPPVVQPAQYEDAHISIFPSLLELAAQNPSTAGAVMGALQELLKATRLMRMDFGQMQSAHKREQESSRQELKDHVSKSLDYLLQLIRSNYDESMRKINELGKTVQLLQNQVEQSSTRSLKSMDHMSTNFYRFYRDISALILSPSTLTANPLAGQYPTAGSLLGQQSPELIPPGIFPTGDQSTPQEMFTTSPAVLQSSTPDSTTSNSQDPSVKDNRTDALGPRMLPIQLEGLSQGGTDLDGANGMERVKISQRKSAITRGCVRPVKQFSPLVIAAGVAYPFVPNSPDESSGTDDDYDVEDAGKTDQVAAGSWGIRQAMALPVRRMLNGDILAFQELLHKHINNHLINVLESNPVWRLHRQTKPRRPKWQRRPKPSKHWKHAYRIVRLPARPGSSLSAESSAERLPSSGLPLILSPPFGHVPPKITMPGMDGRLPYSMAYNDGQGNSFSINVNRRNYPLMSGAYRSAVNGKKRLCRVGKK